MHALCAVSLYVLCVGVNLCHVQDVVCVMCRLLSVLCAGFSMCYVQSLVCVMCSLESRTSSLRSEHASLRSVGRMHVYVYSKLVKTKVGVQILLGGLSSKQEMRYRHIHMSEVLG